MALSGKLRSILNTDKELIFSIKNIFGFTPGNIHLYKLAFKHKSVSADEINGIKVNNERLEYLGDAILSALIADYLFKKYPYQPEGFLTEMRSKIVSRSSLNKLSRKLGLTTLIDAANEKPNQFKSLHGDAFEAFIGALYLDKGYSTCRKILVKHIIHIHIDLEKLEKEEKNYKSRLIEWSQKAKHELDFRMTRELGDGYQKQYQVEIYIDGVFKEQAIDYSIKGAEQLAAEKSWLMLEEEGLLDDN